MPNLGIFYSKLLDVVFILLLNVKMQLLHLHSVLIPLLEWDYTMISEAD